MYRENIRGMLSISIHSACECALCTYNLCSMPYLHNNITLEESEENNKKKKNGKINTNKTKNKYKSY